VQYRLDLLPKQDWLTIDEWVYDKIFLKQVYDRQRQVQLAIALLQQERPASAIDLLENAERRYGDSRFLLEVLNRAYKAMGNEQEAERVRLRLQALLDRRLY
jgi:predicted Zn-dependent protease